MLQLIVHLGLTTSVLEGSASSGLRDGGGACSPVCRLGFLCVGFLPLLLAWLGFSWGVLSPGGWALLLGGGRVPCGLACGLAWPSWWGRWRSVLASPFFPAPLLLEPTPLLRAFAAEPLCPMSGIYGVLLLEMLRKTRFL